MNYQRGALAGCVLLCCWTGMARATAPIFSWDWSGSAPDTFQIQRCTASAGQATCPVSEDLPGGTITGTVQIFTDLSAVSGTNYCWGVLAIVGGVRGPLSNRRCSPDVVTGLVLYYPLDAGTGTTITDATTTHNDGTLLSSATWGAGKWGTGISMTGGAQGISTPASASLNTLAAFSWTAWVYIRSLPLAQPVFANKGADSGQGWFLNINYPASTHLMFDVAFSTQELLIEASSDALTLNGWHLIVATWTGATPSTSMTLYVDGVALTALNALDGVGSRVSDNSHPLLTGTNEGGTDGANMVIDEVRVYNRALSSDDVTMLVTFVPTPITSGPPLVFRLIR